MPANNWIGDFQFISLREVPVGIARRLEVIERPAVDGSGIRRVGRGGRPMSLRSNVDPATFAAAEGLMHLYRELIGANPVPLVWNDVPSLSNGYLVLVLDVVPAGCRAIVTSVGGLNGGLGQLEADWTLLPVPIP